MEKPVVIYSELYQVTATAPKYFKNCLIVQKKNVEKHTDDAAVHATINKHEGGTRTNSDSI